MLNWKKFQFFEKELVRDANNGRITAIEELEATCSAGGQGLLIFGDATGHVHTFNQNFEHSEFVAFNDRVCLLHQLQNANVLVGVGDDGPGLNMGTVKFWNMDRQDPNGGPYLMRLLRVFTPKLPEQPILCFTVSEDLQILAVGLSDGTIAFFRGELSRGDRVPKFKILRPSLQPFGALPTITSLKIVSVPGDVSHNLYVTTTSQVLMYFITPRDEELSVLNAELGCDVSLSDRTDAGDLMICRPEAVYFFNAEGRGPCHAFDAVKLLARWIRGYLVVVNADQQDGDADSAILNIYDISNRMISFSMNVSQVVQIVSEFGCIFVLVRESFGEDRFVQKMYKLKEKDTQKKLDLLFRKSLYSVAINLAYSQGFDEEYIVNIFRIYGDHLYNKADFEAAMDQYLKTVGYLEPSYVIRKFLDAQRIQQLTRYLEALHADRHATADHTTLLLNCYTKLKDDAKLEGFIKTHDAQQYDVQTAIRVLRQADYIDYALEMARVHSHHYWYLKIQIEDRKEFLDALSYISTLDFEDAENYIKVYGKALVSHIPEEATNMLKKLCTEWVPEVGNKDGVFTAPEPDVFHLAEGPKSTSNQPKSAQPEEVINLFVDTPYWLMLFIEHVLASHYRPDETLLYDTLLELYLRDEIRNESSDSDGTREENTEAENQVAVQNREDRRRKALLLLQNPEAKYDIQNALVLVQAAQFKIAILYLFEKLGMLRYHEIVQYHMEHQEFSDLSAACRKYGEKDPNMLLQALTYFAEQEVDVRNEIQQILQRIENNRLIPPMTVVRILANNRSITLGTIKSFISKKLTEEQALIDEDRKQIIKYQQDTQDMRNTIQELRTGAKTFQHQKCSSCTVALDLPSVHFLCMHSFHQGCAGDNENECPICAPQHRKVFDIRRDLEESAQKHDQFIKELQTSRDGFSTVAEYFSRGIFNKQAAVASSSGNASASSSANPMRKHN